MSVAQAVTKHGAFTPLHDRMPPRQPKPLGSSWIPSKWHHDVPPLAAPRGMARRGESWHQWGTNLLDCYAANSVGEAFGRTPDDMKLGKRAIGPVSAPQAIAIAKTRTSRIYRHGSPGQRYARKMGPAFSGRHRSTEGDEVSFPRTLKRPQENTCEPVGKTVGESMSEAAIGPGLGCKRPRERTW